ncbi:MAG: leucine-rich repeat domain-containing protein [Leptospiraceae bacterium]|nr:leucine-rich repeat domain-containing protein [Leptospiraceae bacterium]MCZ8348088.1 leucine-rich repeat domain-containing protein [Leptospiraceae bacterium]
MKLFFHSLTQMIFGTSFRSIYLTILVLPLAFNHCDPKQVNLQEHLVSLGSSEKLSLNHKRFNDSLSIISSVPQLTEIELNYDAIQTIPEEWGNLKRLKKISLYGNQVKELPTSFQNFQDLEILLLGMNPLEKIPHSIQGLPKLKILSLDETKLQLTKEDVKILASLPSLEILDLSENSSLTKIPENISELNFLKSILLKKNKLNEDERKKIFAALPKVHLSK